MRPNLSNDKSTKNTNKNIYIKVADIKNIDISDIYARNTCA